MNEKYFDEDKKLSSSFQEAFRGKKIGSRSRKQLRLII
jgi:hypothetical protein